MSRLGVKRIHLYIAKLFLPMLLMTVTICWFVVVMQFIWQHTDDFVGKGLDFSTLGKVFYHAAMMALPTAMPLGILLASLMTFGGLGERLELLAIKSAGWPLHRVMVSLFVICVALGGGLFIYLNTVMMESQVRFYQIAFSARQKQPDLEIPEGSFYNGIDNYSIFVEKKNHQDKTLLGVLIYDLSQGFEETRIIRADSGKLTMDVSKTFLALDLYSGESFQQLAEPISPTAEKVHYGDEIPASYYKEEFSFKKIIIPFDGNFSLQSDEGLRNQYVGKNLFQLTRYIRDTAQYALDSIGAKNATAMHSLLAATLENTETLPSSIGDSISDARYKAIEDAASGRSVSLDSLFRTLPAEAVSRAFEEGANRLKKLSGDADYMHSEYDWQAYFYRTHDQERHRKFTFPVACIAFFFIGAPLGAIIRKGGIGTPMVTSVLLFIVYYMIDTYGYKMGYNGEWPVWAGMWLSTAFLVPLGAILTYQATRDSASLNIEALFQRIRSFFKPAKKRLLRIRDVIISPTSYEEAVAAIDSAEKAMQAILSSRFMQGGWPTHSALSELNYRYQKAYRESEKMVDKLLDRPGYKMPQLLAELPLTPKVYTPLLPKQPAVYTVLLFFVPLSLPFICYLYIARKRQQRKITAFLSHCKLLRRQLAIEQTTKIE